MQWSEGDVFQEKQHRQKNVYAEILLDKKKRSLDTIIKIQVI